MERILYDVSRWHLLLHREARQMPRAGPEDSPELRLGDELFERLYTGEGELLSENMANPTLRPWAERFHRTCDALPSFSRLAAECRGDAAAAATAVESILEEMELPSAEKPPSPEIPGSSKDPSLRPLIAGCARASSAVEELREATLGLEQVQLGSGRHPGSGTVDPARVERPTVRPLAARLRGDPRLRRIAELAGRMKRITAAKRRQRVKHGADEMSDVEQGGDLGRVLPSELARLGHPFLRLDFLRALLERQLLQYELSGTETLGKGPLVVLLDKSGSMGGPRDIWATALALALLEEARRDQRVYALLGFDARVKFEATVRPGELLPEAGLFVECAGGTDIGLALERGLEIIRTHPGALRKADVILVTDGGADSSVAGKLREEAARLGATVYGLGIGVERSWLSPWCDEALVISELSTLDEPTASSVLGA